MPLGRPALACFARPALEPFPMLKKRYPILSADKIGYDKRQEVLLET